MRPQPGGADLLETARAALLDQVLAALSSDQRHTALMIANAMAIAGRELRAGTAPLIRERDALYAVLGTDTQPVARPDELAEQLAALNRDLCARIRAGAADSAAVHAHLLMVARLRVAESNPRALAAP